MVSERPSLRDVAPAMAGRLAEEVLVSARLREVREGSASAIPCAPAIRARFHIISNERIEHIGKSQSCMRAQKAPPKLWANVPANHPICFGSAYKKATEKAAYL